MPKETCGISVFPFAENCMSQLVLRTHLCFPHLHPTPFSALINSWQVDSDVSSSFPEPLAQRKRVEALDNLPRKQSLRHSAWCAVCLEPTEPSHLRLLYIFHFVYGLPLIGQALFLYQKWFDLAREIFVLEKIDLEQA